MNNFCSSSVIHGYSNGYENLRSHNIKSALVDSMTNKKLSLRYSKD